MNALVRRDVLVQLPQPASLPAQVLQRKMRHKSLTTTLRDITLGNKMKQAGMRVFRARVRAGRDAMNHERPKSVFGVLR